MLLALYFWTSIQSHCSQNFEAEQSRTVEDHIILLFGMPRSGTTWVGKIFDSHPETLYRHEPDSWGLLNDIPLLVSAESYGRYTAKVQDFVSQLPQMRRLKVAASLPLFPKRYYSPSAFALRRASVGAAKLIGRAVGEINVPEWMDRKDRCPIRPVWKSIESVGRFGVIARALPHSRAILILRHPCGHVASVLRGESAHKFTGDTTSEDWDLFDMLLELPQAKRHGLTRAALEKMQAVERLAWRWVLFNEKALEECDALAHAHVLRYEDLCRAPADVAHDLFAFAELSWDAQTANFLQRSTTTERDAYYSIFRNPEKSANRWRSELSADQIAQIMAVVDQSELRRYYSRDN